RCSASLGSRVPSVDGSRAGGEFTRVQRQEIADFQLHSIDFGQETGGGKAVDQGIALDFAQVEHLGLEMPDALLGRFEFLVVGNHPPPRLYPRHMVGYRAFLRCFLTSAATSAWRSAVSR